MRQVTLLLALLGVVALADQGTQIKELFAAQAQIEELLSRQAQLEARIATLEREPFSEGRKLAETLTEVWNKFKEIGTCLDYMWLLLCGALVMFMQAGFAILEAGSCRAKSAGTVLMKNLTDVCIGTIAWYVIGYGLAYGLENPNQFVGTSQFAGANFMETDDEGTITGTGHFKDWFFQWAFCATAATIVSGGVAERIQFVSYLIYATVMTSVIYPFIVYWTWSGEGFLTIKGYSDFAGSGIVHLTGGIGALVGAVIVGPRAGRWGNNDTKRFDPHNMTLVVLGTFILWFGWYGFNCGSTLSFSDVTTATQAALVAMNTTLSAAAGGLTVFLLRLRTRRYDMAGTCNGILAGLVAVCAGVGDFKPGMAMLVGALGGLASEGGHVFVQLLKIDDPLDAFAVHGCGGIIGVLLRPLLDKNGANGEMFAVHCLAIVCIIGWSGGISALVFGALRLAKLLRIPDDEQAHGTDSVELAQEVYRGASKMDIDLDKTKENEV